MGTTYAAFHDEQLVGNICVFWNEAENEQTGKQIGYTQYIFVHPEWRGRNIAQELIVLGHKHLKEHGLDEAHLEVKAVNQNALRLYQNLGFEALRESRFYVLSFLKTCHPARSEGSPKIRGDSSLLLRVTST